jgi:peroxiredoxin family protein
MEYSATHSNQPQQPAYSPHSPTSVEDRLAAIEARIEKIEASAPRVDRVTLLVFSGELDKVLAGLLIASTAASMGMNVTVFFTFWGINVLKEKRSFSGKGVKERMIDMMTPTGPGSMAVSQMNMLGAGRTMLKQMMRDKDIVSAEELLDIARDSGVRLVACSMTMQVMGIREEELGSGIEVAGAASYLVDASHSGCTLFI